MTSNNPGKCIFDALKWPVNAVNGFLQKVSVL